MKLREIRPLGRMIRSFRERRKWSRRNSGASILAFYNTGDGLFVDPYRLPADSHYCLPWQWVRFAEHVVPRYIFASNRKIAGMDDVVPFQTLGHVGQHVRIRIGAFFDGMDWVIHHSVHMIPPLCILYVSVRYGQVVDTLLVSQPLPICLMNKI